MLEVAEVIRCVLLCMLEAVEGVLGLLEVLDMPEVIRCVLLCMQEDMEGVLCLLEMLEMREVMRCVLSVCRRLWRVRSVCWTCPR